MDVDMKTLISLLLFIALTASLYIADAGQDNDVRLTVLAQMPAYYPPLARFANIEAEIELMAYVDVSGAVIETEVRSGRVHPMFEKSVVLAANLSTFQPAIRQGEAVPDSIELFYSFRADAIEDRDHTTTILPFRDLTVNLLSNQICLYGHWLSGDVRIRISEDRVYVDGIRVYPRIEHFDDELNPEFAINSVTSSSLLWECRLFERELAISGFELDAIRALTVEMLEGVRIVESARFVGDHVLVQARDDRTFDLVLPDPRSAVDYFSRQPAMASPEDQFFKWVMDLQPYRHRRFIILGAGSSTAMGVNNDKAVALRDFLQQFDETNQIGENTEWPDAFHDLPRDTRSLVLCPLKVPRKRGGNSAEPGGSSVESTR